MRDAPREYCLLYERNRRMKEYTLSVIAAGIISAIACCIINGKTTSGKMLRMLTGVLMAVTIITPITRISFRNVKSYWDDITLDADRLVTDGQEAAYIERNAIIKSQSEAYILDKATRMGLEIAVEVELDDNNDSVPSQITVSGKLSPYAKGVLSEYITDYLGIPKECQKWM